MESVHSQLTTNLTDEDIGHVLFTQAATVGYLAAPQRLPRAADRVFRDNETAWRALVGERVRASMAVTLEDFVVLEWVPRSPGLYFTERGVRSRLMAKHFVERIERLGSEERYALAAIGDQVIVYNPFGKAAMLQGGLGTIRLKPRSLGGTRHWLLCASATGIAHEGLPIALPDDLYSRCIERIAERGGTRATLTGRLQFLPEDLSALYADYAGVPQLYLSVEELEFLDREDAERSRELRVSVAVSFRSAFNGRNAIYASYVFFDPSRAGSFQRNVEWMEQTYVAGKYEGTILTDFDEQTRRFAGAPFSLSKVMERTVHTEKLLELQEAGVSLGVLKQLESSILIYNRGVIEMGDRVDNDFSRANIGAVTQGQGAVGHGTVNGQVPPQEQHQKAVTEAQKALLAEQDAVAELGRGVYEALGQFLTLARKIQVDQQDLRTVQGKMKDTLDEVWAQHAAKELRAPILPKTLEVAGAIVKNPVFQDVAKKLIMG